MDDNVVSFILEDLRRTLYEEAGLLYELRYDLDLLCKEFTRMNHIITRAVEKRGAQNIVVKDLLNRIRVVAYDAVDTLDKFLAQAAKLDTRRRRRSRLFSFINEAARCRLYREKIMRISAKLSSMYDEIQSALSSQYGRSFSNNIETKINIVVEEENLLINQLITAAGDSAKLEVIPIIGMAGSGKTTLARKVYDSIVMRNHFVCLAFVHVSKTYRGAIAITISVLLIILDALGIKPERRGEIEYLKNLLSGKLKGRRYLIVLDDVWSTEVWNEVSEAFPDEQNGSKIIITSRRSEVGLQANPNPLQQIHLKPLTDEQAWNLFERRARAAGINDYFPESLKQKVLIEAQGLPDTVVVLQEMYSQNEEYLSTFLKDDSYESLELDLVVNYAKLSYPVRSCFLYFGIFPRNADIPVRRLFRLWIAEGFVKDTPRKFPEELAEEYLNKLAEKKLIQVTTKRSDGRPKTCRVHAGKTTDFFLSKAEKIGLFYIHGKSTANANANAAGPSTSAAASPQPQPQLVVRRIVEQSAIKEFLHDVQYVRSFISFNTREKDTPAVDIGAFFSKVIQVQRYGVLRVLDLEKVYKPQLPDQLGNFYYLRYLGLRWTFLDSLPSSVGDLSYLEALDVKHTNITTLPTSIWKIWSLRHLNLNGIRLDMPAKGGNTSTYLETLSGLFVDEKSPIKNGLDRLINFRKLGLTCHSASVEELGRWISTLTNLQSLKLRCKDETGNDQPSALNFSSIPLFPHLSKLYLLGKLDQRFQVKNHNLPKLTVLTLSVSMLEFDPMPMLAQLQSLKVLRLFAHSYVGDKMVCPEGGFSELRVLKLWMLENLEKWRLHKGAMQKLGELEIRSCNNLRKLPKRLLKLRALKTILLTNMKELASVIKTQKQQNPSIKVKIEEATLNLKVL